MRGGADENSKKDIIQPQKDFSLRKIEKIGLTFSKIRDTA